MLVDGRTETRVGNLAIGNCRALFAPDGRSLYIASVRGAHRWPLTWSEDAAEARLDVGPPVLFSLPSGRVETLGLSADGNILAFDLKQASGDDTVLVVDLASGGRAAVELRGHSPVNSIAVSPRGKWIATGTWQGDLVVVWNGRTGERV